ncbi:hypothetical protein J5N97_016964 [Dioscorea zingiberensis]|uniref:Uncharacterized protein n=1 Tax=Dioscorea zingiberensis TaxID=325984 RepID=A0A9D5CL73_9LILI|nr:hypothetical protein J5N97_016964 [Dioscorea zingiberensis]
MDGSRGGGGGLQAVLGRTFGLILFISVTSFLVGDEFLVDLAVQGAKATFSSSDKGLLSSGYSGTSVGRRALCFSPVAVVEERHQAWLCVSRRQRKEFHCVPLPRPSCPRPTHAGRPTTAPELPSPPPAWTRAAPPTSLRRRVVVLDEEIPRGRG